MTVESVRELSRLPVAVNVVCLAEGYVVRTVLGDHVHEPAHHGGVVDAMLVEHEPVGALVVHLGLLGKGHLRAGLVVVVDVLPVVLHLLLGLLGVAKEPVPKRVLVKEGVSGVLRVGRATVVGCAVCQAIHVREVRRIDGDGLEYGELLGGVEAQGVVRGQAAGSRMIGAANLVGHGLVERLKHVLGAGGNLGARLYDAPKVHHVGVAFSVVVASVVLGSLYAARHGRKRSLVVARRIHLLREAIEVLHELVNLREVHHRECGKAPCG